MRKESTCRDCSARRFHQTSDTLAKPGSLPAQDSKRIFVGCKLAKQGDTHKGALQRIATRSRPLLSLIPCTITSFALLQFLSQQLEMSI